MSVEQKASSRCRSDCQYRRGPAIARSVRLRPRDTNRVFIADELGFFSRFVHALAHGIAIRPKALSEILVDDHDAR